MNILQLFVGIDVAKFFLDVLVFEGSPKRFVNSEAGIAEMVLWLKEQAGEREIAIGLEATSTYHRSAMEALSLAGMQVHCYNPRQVRDLAKGLGILAKTDKVDAMVLARCVQLVASPHVARSEIAYALRDISRQIQYLTDQRSNLIKRGDVPGRSALALESDQRMMAALKAEIQGLDNAWLKLAAESPLHLERFRLLISVPRIGPKTARVIASELPEDLSPYSRKQLAAYFGLVPYDQQSGLSKAKGTIGHRGNAHGRKALFTVAALAMFRDPECLIFAQRLRDKGKHHLQIVAAVMHKLLRRAIAVLLRGTPWEERLTLTT
jgi:transposase